MKRLLSILLVLILLASALHTTAFSANVDQSTEAASVYMGFLESFGYLADLNNYYDNTPTRYAFLDINKDGTQELLVQAAESTGFCYTCIYTLNTLGNKVVLVADLITYGDISYSSKYKCLKYIYPRPAEWENIIHFSKLTNNQIVNSFSITYDEYDGVPKCMYMTYDDDGNIFESYRIAELKRQEYIDTCVDIIWTDLYKETLDGLLYMVNNNEVIIAGYVGSSSDGKVTIPSEIEGYPVTEIQSLAFTDYFIKTIEIPKCIKVIHDSAFSGCFKLNKVNFGGTKSQWDNINIGDNNEYLLEASLQTSFDEQEYKHCYAKVIYDAIKETQNTYTYAYEYGYGMIQDVDGNKAEELLICYFSKNANDFPVAVCSVYTMNQNVAIPLIEGEELFTDAGAPYGECSIVEKDGKKYIVIASETGETSISGTRTGKWDLYSLDGDSITRVTDIEYTYYRSNGSVVSSKSSSIINGKASTYNQYKNHIAQYKTLHKVVPYYDEVSLPLEELLEYTKTLPVKDKAIAVYTTDQSFSIKTGESLGLGFAIQQGGELLTEEWKKMSVVVSDNSVVSVSDYMENQYGYSIQIKGKKEGKTNLTITDMESGLSTIIEVSVYDQYSRTYTYEIENMRSFYPGVKQDSHLLTNIYNLNGIYVKDYKCVENANSYSVSFKAYNNKKYTGAVDVYDSEGNWIRCQAIDKFTNSSSFLEIGKDIYYLSSNLHWLAYDQESTNKRSDIAIEVPKGGYFTISNNFSSSPGTYLFNTTDLLIDAILDTIDLGVNGVEPSEFAKLIMEEIQKSPKARELFIEAFKDIVEGSLENYAKNIASGRIEEANSDLINEFDILMGAAKIEWVDVLETAAGVGGEALTKYMGPYGMAISAMFDFNKTSDKFIQVRQFANSINEPYVKVVTVTGGDIIESDGVIINTNGNTDSEAVLQVFRISNSDVINLVLNSDDPLETYQIYNISFVKDDKTVQPNGKVKVYLPIPEGMNGDTCNVFRQEENGNWTTITAHREGNNIVFETDHFSLYAVVGKEYPLTISSLPEKLNYKPGETLDTKGLTLKYAGKTITDGYICSPAILYGLNKQTVVVEYGCMSTEFTVNIDGAVLGDVDTDGELSILDASAMQLHMAKKRKISLLGQEYSDTDGDGEFSVMDAAEIQLFLAKRIPAMRG